MRSGHVCVKRMHCSWSMTKCRDKFKRLKSNKTIFYICYDTYMPKYCLRSTGKALWLPLHTYESSVVLHSILVDQILKCIQPLCSKFSRDERNAFLMF